MKIICFIFLAASLISQERVTLPEAIALALEQNYDIQIARNVQLSSDKGVTKAFSDNFLPSLNIFISSRTQIAEQQVRVGGVPVPGATEVGTSTFAAANYGVNLRINDIYQAIKGYARASTENDKQYNMTISQIQSLVKSVMNNYFNLAKQQNLLKVYRRAVETSKQQVERAQSRYEIGSAAKKDVMSQKVQLNNDRSAFLRQKLLVKTAQNQLNISLGRKPFKKILVDESVSMNKKYSSYEELEASMLDKNPELKASKESFNSAKIQEDQADYNLYFPSLGISLGYNKDVGRQERLSTTFDELLIFDKNFVSHASVFLSYNFNWGKVIQSQQAELSKNNAELRKLKKERELKALLYQSYITYTNSLEQLTLQKENVEASREDLRLAQERYKLGSGTSIDLRQAQDGLTRSETNLVNAKFDAKLAEVEIERLLGKIKIK